MDFLEAQNYLEKVRSQKGIVLGLDTMRHLMAKLNNPGRIKSNLFRLQEQTARDQQLPISLQSYLRQELK